MKPKSFYKDQCNRCKHLQQNPCFVMPNPKDTLYSIWCFKGDMQKALKEECKDFEKKED